MCVSCWNYLHSGTKCTLSEAVTTRRWSATALPVNVQPSSSCFATRGPWNRHKQRALCTRVWKIGESIRDENSYGVGHPMETWPRSNCREELRTQGRIAVRWEWGQRHAIIVQITPYYGGSHEFLPCLSLEVCANSWQAPYLVLCTFRGLVH